MVGIIVASPFARGLGVVGLQRLGPRAAAPLHAACLLAGVLSPGDVRRDGGVTAVLCARRCKAPSCLDGELFPKPAYPLQRM